ncbi:MAG: protein kinase [Gammaproteobacteria bacterium]
MKDYNQTQDRLKNLGFRHIEELGKGQFGIVSLYQYKGSDEAIKQLCDSNGRIAIKVFNQVDENELQIAEHFQTVGRTEGEASLYNVTKPLKDGDQLIGILSQYIAYDNSPKNPKASDLQAFIKDVARDEFEPKIGKAFRSDLAMNMNQLMTSMQEGQNALHDIGVIHLDTSTRNYLLNKAEIDDKGRPVFSVTIADYGLSKVITENEDFAVIDGPTLPSRWMDFDSIFKSTATVRTDLFALKASMMGMIGLVLGQEQEKDVLALGGDFLDLRSTSYRDDNATLMKYLQNVEELINTCKDDYKKKELQTLVDCFKPFLTSMPEPSLSSAEACQADNQLFATCSARLTQRLELLSIVDKVEGDITSKLQENKWILTGATDTTKKPDANLQAIYTLKQTLDQLRTDIDTGVVTNRSDVQERLQQPMEAAIATSEQKQRRGSFLGILSGVSSESKTGTQLRASLDELMLPTSSRHGR